MRPSAGSSEMDAFAKLYLVPGMHHCGGGPGPNEFDMLPVLENWVEKGESPGAVLASRVIDGRVDRTRPLCPHPQVARYAAPAASTRRRASSAPRRKPMRDPLSHGEPAGTGRAALSWQTDEPTGIGSGWVSGLLGAICGVLGLGAVLCFHFPWLLTIPEARALYPLPLVRGLLHLALVSGFLLGIASLSLRRNKMLGAIAVTATMAAALLGGSQVPIAGEAHAGPFLGLDWFLLNLIVYSAVFVPLERMFGRLPQQHLFRASWRTDFTYFFISAILVQVTTILTLRPAMVLFDWARSPAVQTRSRRCRAWCSSCC